LELANALLGHGIDVALDHLRCVRRRAGPTWCEEQLRPENSGFVLMICTETYLKRVQDQVPADEGRGVFWEGAAIYGYIYNQKGNERFIPILLDGAGTDAIPVLVRKQHTLPDRGV